MRTKIAQNYRLPARPINVSHISRQPTTTTGDDDDDDDNNGNGRWTLPATPPSAAQRSRPKGETACPRVGHRWAVSILMQILLRKYYRMFETEIEIGLEREFSMSRRANFLHAGSPVWVLWQKPSPCGAGSCSDYGGTFLARSNSSFLFDLFDSTSASLC